MSIEHGIRLGSLSFSKLENSGRLKDLLERFDWVYLGPEFCENLLENAVVSEIVRFQEKGKIDSRNVRLRFGILSLYCL